MAFKRIALSSSAMRFHAQDIRVGPSQRGINGRSETALCRLVMSKRQRNLGSSHLLGRVVLSLDFWREWRPRPGVRPAGGERAIDFCMPSARDAAERRRSWRWRHQDSEDARGFAVTNARGTLAAARILQTVVISVLRGDARPAFEQCRTITGNIRSRGPRSHRTLWPHLAGLQHWLGAATCK